MDNKKSVIIYTDLIHTFEKLSDTEAGVLIKHFFRYVNDQNPEPPDRLTDIAFEPIKLQLKRDLIKWNEALPKKAEAGRLGGIKSGEARREKKQNEANEANEASASNTKQNEANEGVIVNVTVTDINNRKKSFYDANIPFLEKYGKDMLRDFYEYWTEPSKSGKVLRFEQQKFWDLSKRLATWAKRSDFDPNKKAEVVETKEQELERRNREFLARL